MSRRVLSSRVVERCRVVVDNDFAGDPDGLLALAHHLLSPSNRVVGITSSFLDERLLGPLGTAGRTAAEGVDAVVALLDQIQPTVRPPVWAGAEVPWTPDAQPSAASEAIVAEARADSPLPLVVVCGGPLTNVAAALLHDPGIADRLSLVWIGGSLTPDTFEYNRDTDPSSAESVFLTEVFRFTRSRCRPTGAAPSPWWSWKRISRPPGDSEPGSVTGSRIRRTGSILAGCGRWAIALRCSSPR